MSNKEKRINLYVLRYIHSGYYYVGTAEDFKNRMLVHWRRESAKRLPEWSYRNKSKEGFVFFWFNIEDSGVSQSWADLCENHLAKLITKKIKYINEKRFIKEVHVGNGGFVDGKNKDKVVFDDENIENEINDIDKEIYVYLKKIKSLKPKKIPKKLLINCFKIGYVGEYHQNDSWDKAVAWIEFPCDNK